LTKTNYYDRVLTMENSMKLIANGATANVYLDNDNKVIKLFKDNFSKKYIEKEVNGQKIIYEMGIPVPKIFDVIELNGRSGIVMEYINGISLGEKLLKNNNYVNGIDTDNNNIEINNILYCVNSIIDLQIMVNKIILQEYPLMKEKLIKQINSVECLNKYQKNIFIEKINAIVFKNNLCHGDFHPFNLIETNNGIKIIDWADATIGNKEADVYRTYMIFKLNSDEIGEKYLELYCKKPMKAKQIYCFMNQ
jgi:RIO-like serine/threonine protein kinase